MSEIDEVKPWDKCSICGKPVRYWHDYLVESDDLVETKWHKNCAKDFEQWAYKITHILPTYERPLDIPIGYRWDRYFENYQRRLSSIDQNKKRD